MKASLLLIFFVISGLITNAQQTGLFEFREFQDAVNKGTRTRDGLPGEKYWQNTADYTIEATVDTAENMLKGTASIRYHNNSADSLRGFLLRIYQDLFDKANARMEPVSDKILHDGVVIDSLLINGIKYIAGNEPVDSRKVTRYNTLLYIRLNELIRKGASARIDIGWSFSIPDAFSGHLDRMGRYNKAIFMGLWYPQVAVYDDMVGWDDNSHLGVMEFYNDFNNYDVIVNVPDGYMIWATGECINMNEVLHNRIIQKYEQAKTADTVVSIITRDDYNTGVITGNRWHFRADHVPDFAFAMAPGYLWEGTSVVVDKQTNRRVFLDIASPNDSLKGFNSLDILKSAIVWASDSFPGVPFPYEHATVFLNGSKNRGSMEYPMLMNNSSYIFRGLHNAVIVHEAYHNYMPFFMGFNETSYMWMDEGFTQFNEHKFTGDGMSLQVTEIPMYPMLAGKTTDYPLMSFSISDMNVLSFMTYFKPCNNLFLLETLLGRSNFLKATREFMKNWNGKHPSPYDMFYSYSRFAPFDLNWFWKACYFEPGYADLAIKSAERKNVVIEKKGNIPVPVYLEVVYEDNSREKTFANLDIWKDGATQYTAKLKTNKNIKSVKLGNLLTPDANPQDNTYENP